MDKKCVSNFKIGDNILWCKEERKIHQSLYIGDSYGVGEPFIDNRGWCHKVPIMLRDPNYLVSCVGGAGFCVDGKKFLDLFKLVENDIDDKNLTNIYVMGGFNDAYYDFDTINTNIKDFCDYVYSRYKNVTIYISCIGWCTFEQTRVNIVNNVQRAYALCSLYGAIYLSGCEYVLHDYSLLGSDGVHPNENGYNVLNANISSMICGNNMLSYNFRQLPITASGISSQVVNAYYCELFGKDSVTVSQEGSETFGFNCNTNITGNTYYELAKFDFHYLKPLENGYVVNANVDGYITTSAGVRPMNGVVKFSSDGKLLFASKKVLDGGGYETFNNVTQIAFIIPQIVFPLKYS